MTEELEVPELPTIGSASLFKVKHCGFSSPMTSVCGPPTHRIAAVGAQILDSAPAWAEEFTKQSS